MYCETVRGGFLAVRPKNDRALVGVVADRGDWASLAPLARGSTHVACRASMSPAVFWDEALLGRFTSPLARSRKRPTLDSPVLSARSAAAGAATIDIAIIVDTNWAFMETKTCQGSVVAVGALA
jgi:hypothetical protein